jgi:putative PEP-CTERM system TPR-repeat lipoprotein
MKALLEPVVFFKRIVCIFVCLMVFTVKAETAEDYEKALISFNQEAFRESYIHLKNALQKTPDHLPSKLLIGRIFLIDGYPDAAITEFEEIAQAGADFNLVVLPLANAYLMNRQFDKVIELAIPRNANKATQLDIYLLKATAYIQQDNYSMAESMFVRAKTKFGDDIRVLNGLAQLALLNKDYIKSKELITQALVIQQSNAQSHMISGLLFQAEKQYDQALTAFETAYQYAPKDPAIMRALANSYAQLGDISKASNMVVKIEAQTPGSLQTKLLKARLLAMAEKSAEADAVLTELSQTLSLADKTNEQYVSKISVVAGIIAHLNKNFDISVRELKRYLNNEEPSAEIVAMLAEGYIRTNEINAAMELLERHEQLILDNIQIASLACDLYLSKNKVFKCDSLVQQLKQHHGSDAQDVILLEAKILSRRKYPQKALDILQTKLANNTSNDTVLFRASLLASIGRYDEALVDAQSLLRNSPDRLDYQLLNIDLFIRLEEFEQANLLLENVLKQDPDNLAGLIHLSRIRFAFDDLQGASTTIDKVLNLDKANFSALLLSGQIFIKQNQLSKATDQLIAAKTINPTSTSPRELLISIYKQQESLKLAISELNQLLKLRPSEAEYIYEKAKVYLALEQPENAKKELNQLFFLWGEQPEKLVQLSRLQMANMNFDEAEKSLQVAQQISPNYLIAQLEYANFLLTKNEFSQADEHLKKLHQKYPSNPNVQLVLGHLFKQTGEVEKAYQSYYKALELSPSFTASLIELYKLADQNVHRTDIINIFSQLVTSKPENNFSRHLYADLLYLEGQLGKAEDNYRKLILVDKLPNKANVFNNLANIVSSKDITKAISYAQLAIDLNPNSSAILDTYGWLLTKNNEPEQGLNILRQAYTLNSDSPTIRYHLAYTLNKLGRDDEAKKELILALDSKQEFQDREQAQTLLLAL